MKKAILLTVLFAVLTSVTFSQVAINETGEDPDPSAILDLSSTDKGFLVPRVSTTERNAIGTTQSGLLVYDIDTESFWYYNNMLASWVEMSGGGEDSDWIISGNNIYSSVSGNVGIGTTNPSSKLQVRNGNLSLVSQYEDAYIKLLSDEEEDLTPAYIWSENAKGFSVGSTPGTAQMLINAASGNVGIGTTNPSQKLSVRDGNMSLVSEGSDSYIKLGSNELANAISSYIWTDDNVGFAIGSTQGIPQMVVDNTSGNVGIGTTNPGAKLEVAGQIKVTGGNPGTGKVLTSDINGLGSWESIPLGVHEIDDLSDAKTDGYSLFLGSSSGINDDGGNYNTSAGQFSFNHNISGIRNAVFGTYSMFENESGNANTAIGYAALYKNETGNSNVALGIRSLYKNTDRSNLVAIGDSALFNNGLNASLQSHSTRNTAVGSKAMCSNTIGRSNIALGYESMKSNIGGSLNTAVGCSSLNDNTEGDNNTALGYIASFSNTSGDNNIALGSMSLYSNQTGSNNIAIGRHAGFNTLGSGNVFIGHEAGLNESGSNKLYISNSSTDTPLIFGDFNSNLVSLNGDVAIGSTFADGYKLSVEGKIICEELRVDLQEDWPDYVFKKDYKLLPLNEVEEFINKNGHLPNIPSASEMNSSGLEIGETQRLLMEKIEELTLYIIEQQKLIDQLIEKTK